MRPALLFVLAALSQAPDAAPPAASNVPAPESAAPAPTPSEDYGGVYDSDAALPAHAEDVVDYTLRASLDPTAHTVHGQGTIHWRNASNTPVRELWMHLYLNAFKNERSVFLTDPAGGFRGSTIPADWAAIDVRHLRLVGGEGAAGQDLWPGAELGREPAGQAADETDARVPLPHEVAPGETITLDVEWEDKLPTVVERTGYLGTFHMVAQWFPKIARLEPDGRWAHFPFHHLAEFYADFGTYDVTLDVPAPYLLGATGPIVESRIEEGRRIERHIQSDVHDFAWTAWDRWQESRESIDGVSVRILYPPGFGAVEERELAAIRFALPHFRKRYGRYPYAVLTLVHPPYRADEAGGMEYPTLITTGSPWYTPPGVLWPEIVTIHEFGHQYFYGLIATDETKWPFLDEGLNTFAEAEALDAWKGAGSEVDIGGLSVSDFAVNAVVGNAAEHDQPVAQPAPAFDSGLLYGALIYSRTGTVVETLRRVWGSPAVDRALGRYARHNRFRHPEPDDLIRAFEQTAGERAAAALKTALFDEGWVDYAVTGIESRKASPAGGLFDRGGKRETVAAGGTGDGTHQGWVLVTRRGTLAFPVDVELTFDDGTSTRVRWEGDAGSTRIPYHGKAALVSAVVDPDQRVLLDDDRTNNHASTEGSSHSAVRTLERLTYWLEILLQSVAP